MIDNIQVDFRENDCAVSNILSQRYGLNVTKTHLKIGDYLIGSDTVVERKTALDFRQSIIDGRLFRQAKAMRLAFTLPVLIIEGDNLYNTAVNIHSHAIKGALTSLALAWRIPVLFSVDCAETAAWLWLIAHQDTAFKSELSYRPGRRPKKAFRRQLYILQGLPGVGPKLAGSLLNHFGSVERVITATQDELMEIKGLGKLKTQKIREIVV